MPGFNPVTASCASSPSHKRCCMSHRYIFSGKCVALSRAEPEPGTAGLLKASRRVKSGSDSWQAFDMGVELDITRSEAQLSRVGIPSPFLQMLNHKCLAGRGGPPNMWDQPIRAPCSPSTTTKSCSRKQWSQSRARPPLLHERKISCLSGNARGAMSTKSGYGRMRDEQVNPGRGARVQSAPFISRSSS